MRLSRRASERPLSPAEEWHVNAARMSEALRSGWRPHAMASPIPLFQGEHLHAGSQVTVSAFESRDVQYSRGFMLAGGSLPAFLASAAASMAYNSHQRSRAERHAMIQWRPTGHGQLYVTSMRVALQLTTGWTDIPLNELRALEQDAVGLVLWRSGTAATRLETVNPSYLHVLLAWLAFGWLTEVIVDEELRDRAQRLGHDVPAARPPPRTVSIGELPPDA